MEMSKKTAELSYKTARAFVEWKMISESSNPQMEEVGLAWKRLMMAEAQFKEEIGLGDGTVPSEEPCADCPDEDS